MTRVSPEELSALMDGELSTDRAREVERHLATDADLQAEFHRLCQNDARWRAEAMTAAFRPTLRLPTEDNRLRQVVGATALVVALTAVRVATKLTASFVFSFGVQGVALICIVAVLVWVTRGSDIDAQATPINSGVTL